MANNARLLVMLMTLSVILLATVGVLGWLWYLHGADTRSAAEVQASEAQQRRLQEMDTEIRDLQTKLKGQGTGTPDAALQAQEDRMKQQRELIAGQLALAQGELKDAQEMEKRTRDAGTAFLGVFAILAAAVLGQGYLNLFEFRKDSEAKVAEFDTKMGNKVAEFDRLVATKTTDFDRISTRATELEGKLDAAQKKFDEQSEKLQASNKEIAQAAGVVEEIQSSWASLDDKIPKFKEEADKLLAREGDLQQSEQLALMQELDAFTYLYPRMRFGDKGKERDRSANYYQSLIQSVRGQIVERKYQQALRRLKCVVEEGREFLPATDLARAHAFIGNVNRLLADHLLEQPEWVIEANKDNLQRLTAEAWSGFKAADAADPKLLYTTFARAQFHRFLSRAKAYAPFSADGFSNADEVQCHRDAAAEYSKLMGEMTFLNRHAVLQNLACELKLVAAETGDGNDRSVFERTVEAYPGEDGLRQEYLMRADLQDRRPLIYLWPSMLQDEDLFASSGKIATSEYAQFWVELLDKKVKRDWRKDLAAARKDRADWVLQPGKV